MARPIKIGLDYFPLDCVVDDQIELIEAKYGLEAFAIIVKIWQKIYLNGYYIDWEDDTILLFSKRINYGVNEIKEIVNECLLRNVFSYDLYEKYSILTSKGVQKRYLGACKASKRKTISAVEEFLLITGEEKGFITELTPLNSEFSTQKKGKERKRKEKKELNTLSELSDDETEEQIFDEEDLPPMPPKILKNNNEHFEIFDHWNDQSSLTTHKELNLDMRKQIDNALKSFKTVETIKELITRYNQVNSDPNYFWSYKWTLVDFLCRKNGISSFTDEGSKWVDYTKDDLPGSNSKKVIKYQKVSDLPEYAQKFFDDDEKGRKFYES